MYRTYIITVMILCIAGCLRKKEDEPLGFSDDFESYSVGEYPSSNGWYVLWDGTGSGNTYVVDDVAHGGDKSFMLSGYPNWTRTDGVEVGLGGVDRLTYEISVMIPSNSATGAYFGFFVRTSYNESRNYNGVFFNSADSLIYVKGLSSTNTGYTWEHDVWYTVIINIDFENLLLDAWVNGHQVAYGVEAAHRDTSDIFSISTSWIPINGVSYSYFDDIEIYEIPEDR